MPRMSLVLAGAALAAMTSCTTAPPAPAGAEAQARLQQLLAGKVAGATTSCVPGYQASSGSIVAPDAIAITPNQGLVYVADTRGTGCEGVAGPTLALVVNSHGPTGLCGGDMVQVRDVHTGVMEGSCLLRGFTQYHNP